MKEKQGRRRTFSEIFESASIAGSSYRIIIRRRFKEIGIDLTVEMLQVLDQLWEVNNQNQQSLANNLYKDKVSITSLIDNLTKRGFVQRVESPVDKRAKLIRLTPYGEEMEAEIKSVLEAIRSQVIEGISEEQMKQVVEYYEKLNANIVTILEQKNDKDE